jgi:hypothetical protein
MFELVTTAVPCPACRRLARTRAPVGSPSKNTTPVRSSAARPFGGVESGSNPAASCLIGREGTSCGCKDRLLIIALPKGTRCPKTWVKRRLALGADRLVCASRTEHKGLLTALVPVERVQLNYSREEA